MLPNIAPSLLSCDFANLQAEAQRMLGAGAHSLHLDVMDGHFVPNLTLGPPIVKALRRHTNAVLDCHLMVSNPLQWVKAFEEAGATIFTFHIEAQEDPIPLIGALRKTTMKIGISIKPSTPLASILPFVPLIDRVLVMTVEPGFGGQKMMVECLDKVRVLRRDFKDLDIQVDGGIDLSNIQLVAEAGANSIVSGTGVFGHDSPKEAIRIMTETVAKYC